MILPRFPVFPRTVEENEISAKDPPVRRAPLCEKFTPPPSCCRTFRKRRDSICFAHVAPALSIRAERIARKFSHTSHAIARIEPFYRSSSRISRSDRHRCFLLCIENYRAYANCPASCLCSNPGKKQLQKLIQRYLYILRVIYITYVIPRN